MMLCDIDINDVVTVLGINDDCNIKKRLMDLGVIPGTKIKCLFRSPFGDPCAYMIRGSVISIRDCDARKIVIFYE